MKTQMKFQKILALLTLIVAALTFVFALSFMTDVSNLYYYISASSGGVEAFSGADAAYNAASSTTDVIFAMSIVFILLAVSIYVTASNSRRNYYITNYISIAATAVFAVILAIVGIALISNCVAKYVAMDHQAYFDKAFTWTKITTGETQISSTAPDDTGLWQRTYTYYSDSSLFFILGYICYVIVLVIAAANVFNLLWKIKLMKGEKALLAKGLVKEVA